MKPNSQVLSAIAIVATLTIGSGTEAWAQTPLDEVAFMSGCWEGPFESEDGAGTIEERYTPATADLMLGTTRYLLGGRVIMFEFSAIRRDSSGIVLTPYPGGVRSEHGFRLTERGERSAVFEAPGHDFPKRVVYRLAEDGALVARIDAGEDSDEATEWRMTAVDCLPGH